MTIFGIDTSHYDGKITKAIALKALAEGIVFATAKIGEGYGDPMYVDPLFQNNITSFRDAGLEVLGGYYVVRTPGWSVSRQVDHCIATVDRLIPWWSEFPGWFFQVDLELWGYDNVSASTGMEFGNELADKTGKTAVMYASRGMYGDKLTPWAPRPLWNANYGSNPSGPFKTIYPGDTSVGWRPYSNQTPALLQYGSRATIAGLTTCDANAYRGTLDQLLKMINGGPEVTADEFLAILKDPAVAALMRALPWQYQGGGIPAGMSTLGVLNALYVNTDTVEAALAAINTKLDNLVVDGGTALDLAAIKSIVNGEINMALNSTKLITVPEA
jgi:GH25 family lysozyme M1 (1,4-beta-N-acetylmuramidase)